MTLDAHPEMVLPVTSTCRDFITIIINNQFKSKVFTSCRATRARRHQEKTVKYAVSQD